MIRRSLAPLRDRNGKYRKEMSSLQRRLTIIFWVNVCLYTILCISFLYTPHRSPGLTLAHHVRVTLSHDRAPVTMYNSLPEQTDASPCIAADGTNICKAFDKGESICAANDYKFGTILNIEGIGDCVVHDRLNHRYDATGWVDVYAGMDHQKALSFGKKIKDIQVIVISD